MKVKSIGDHSVLVFDLHKSLSELEYFPPLPDCMTSLYRKEMVVLAMFYEEQYF